MAQQDALQDRTGEAEARGQPRLSLAAAGLRGAARRIADAVMPPLCLSCHERIVSHDSLCPACWSRIDFIRPPLCDRLGIPMPFDTGGTMISAAAAADPPVYHRARAVARFDGVMRELIHEMKFKDRHDARLLFSRWLLDAGAELLADAHVAVPVPLSRTRLLSRRFNQAALLAQDVARRRGLLYAPLVLHRTRKTRSQVGLTRAQRRDNVSGAFGVDAHEAGKIANRNIVLFDDVITTGATVDACAQALRRGGAARVDVLVLAIVTDVALVPA
jgi:ComF family protein